jgi:hypothetical protein
MAAVRFPEITAGNQVTGADDLAAMKGRALLHSQNAGDISVMPESICMLTVK